MKQNITIDQLNQLNEKGKKSLRKWWKPEEGNKIVYPIKGCKCYFPNEAKGWEVGVLFTYDIDGLGEFFDFDKKEKGHSSGWYGAGGVHYHSAYPLLSIGQMIEFLEEHTNGNDFVIRIHSAGIGWQKPGQRLVDIDGLRLNEIEDEIELCDALWEAVKELIEKENKI